MAVATAGAIGVVQKQNSLRFTGDGGGGDIMTVPVPNHLFPGQIVGSMWYHIENTDPETGDLAISLIEAGVNTLQVGINYSVGDEGIFYADLNGFRFESGVLFDADDYGDWMHFAFYIDWLTPANSLLFWNNVSQILVQVPATNSTQFAPTESITDISGVVQDVEWGQIFIAPPSPDTTPANFATTVLPRFSNGRSPYSLGRHGGLAQGNRDPSLGKTMPWICTSFADKLKDGNPLEPRNDFQDGIITFGGFTDYELHTDANITLPSGAIANARRRAQQNKRR